MDKLIQGTSAELSANPDMIKRNYFYKQIVLLWLLIL